MLALSFIWSGNSEANSIDLWIGLIVPWSISNPKNCSQEVYLTEALMDLTTWVCLSVHGGDCFFNLWKRGLEIGLSLFNEINHIIEVP